MVRIQIEHHKESPKGVVSCLENSEGVTAVGVRVRHSPQKEQCGTKCILCPADDVIGQSYYGLYTVALLYGFISVMVSTTDCGSVSFGSSP